MAFCASEAVQIHGGTGFMGGTKVERIYREVKVDAEEIMKALAARQLRLWTDCGQAVDRLWTGCGPVGDRL